MRREKRGEGKINPKGWRQIGERDGGESITEKVFLVPGAHRGNKGWSRSQELVMRVHGSPENLWGKCIIFYKKLNS